MRDRLTQRLIEQYQQEELSEHYEESRKYFINLLSLFLFIGSIFAFIAIQNHYSIYTQYKQYDLEQYEQSVEASVLNVYESEKGQQAVAKYEQYKKLIDGSSLPKADQNYILAQKALILDLPETEELKKLSHYFEYEVDTKELDYINIDHSIVNSFIFAYSPYNGTERKMLVKLQAELNGNITSKLIRENYVNLFFYNTSVMLDKWNKPIIPFIPIGLIYLIIYGFVFAIVYGVINNLSTRYDIYKS